MRGFAYLSENALRLFDAELQANSAHAWIYDRYTPFVSTA